MKPVSFKHQNKVLRPGHTVYSEDVTSVVDLPVWTNGEQCVSCWQMSWQERLSVLLHGRVWLAVLSGNTQPPVSLVIDKEYFRVEEEE
jgi:hypothetical protein